MEQTLVIKGRGGANCEEITKIQEEANRKTMAVRRAKTGTLIATNALVSLFILLPLLYAVSATFMLPGELLTTEISLVPRQPTLDNFKQVLVRIPLVRFVCNSFITAGPITMGQVVSCSLAAFSFSLLEFEGKNVLFMLIMATMMIPGETTIISNYLTVSQWNWLDSYQVLIMSCLTSAMGTFLFRQFYKSLPISLYESAKIDGCGNFGFISCTLLPLTKLVTGAMAMYTFVNVWNMYMWPLLVTGSNEIRIVQIGISALNSMDTQFITLMIAGMAMIVLPSISIFILGQKQLMWDMFSGAIRGQAYPGKSTESNEVRINYKRRDNNYEKEINRSCCSSTDNIHADRVWCTGGGHGRRR